MIKHYHLFLIFVPLIFLVTGAIWLVALQAGWTFSVTKKNSSTSYSHLFYITPDTPLLGTSRTTHHIIFFGDMNCISCDRQIKILLPFIQANPTKVSVVWESTPISFPESTVLATKYAYCANQQHAFWLFVNKTITDNATTQKKLHFIAKEVRLNPTILKHCINSPQATAFIKTQQTLATSLSIQHVPTIFLDDIEIPTPTSTVAWKILLGL